MQPTRVDIEQNTDEWHRWRDSGGADNPTGFALGASDAPVIAGTSPYATVDDLWRQKTGLAPKPKPTWIMERGHFLEAEAREMYTECTGIMTLPACFSNPELPWMLASLDGLDADGTIAQEFKLHGAADHEMVKSGTCPLKHYAQLQHQLVVSGAEVVHLVSYYKPKNTEGPGDLAVVPVFFDPAYTAQLIAREREFIECCLAGTPPSERDTFKTALRPTRTQEAPGEPVTTPQPEVVIPESSVEIVPADSGDAVVSVQTLSVGESTIVLAPAWVQQRDEWIAEATTIQITDQTSADRAGTLINAHTSLRTAIDKASKKATKPHSDIIKRIRDVAEQLLALSVPVETDLKARLAAWITQQEALRLEAEKKQLAAMASGEEVESAIQAATQAITGRKKAAGVATTRTVRIEVVDPAAVPAAFLSPDIQKIEALAKETVNKDTWGTERRTLVPGVVAWVETSVRGTGR